VSILINSDTKVVVQGITGRDGSFHTQQMQDYGTKVVAGVTPGKGGQTAVGDIPVFNTVQEACNETGANVSVMYVPAKFAKDAMMDAAESDIELLVVITEGVPTLDVLAAYEELSEKGVRMIGPNCPGLIVPGQCKIGIMPGHIHTPGKVAVVSRSGTLTYEIVKELSDAGLGQSVCIGIGGDPIIGSKFIDLLPLLNDDPETEAIVLVGEIGGEDEVVAAEYVRDHIQKTVIGFVAGKTAPPGRRMGHAGALVGGEEETAEAKIKKMEDCGIRVASLISEVKEIVGQ